MDVAHDRRPSKPGGPRLRKSKRSSSDALSSPHSPSRPDSPDTHADVAIQATPDPKPSSFVTPPPLVPPPAISFESTPIPWKGLPFDVAQWTFSSDELQTIVSKAIRLSARESFVRLLSVQALESDIVHESRRLDAERASAQAKWRFEVGRRTMLLQALNATIANHAPDDGENLAATFVGQLASAVASCDAILSSIGHYSDQQAQIQLLEQQHWSSALSVALRKLSSAYDRQGQELKRAQATVQTLEDELEEAWREAEKMAIEFDELEHDVASQDDDHLDELVVRQDTPPGDLIQLDLLQANDDTATVGDMTINTDVAIVLGVTATAVASKATLIASPKQVDKDRSDTKSIRSVKSTHIARLSAARTRSRAASNASLRLPKALRSPTTSSPPSPPPIPTLVFPQGQDQSFLDMDAIAHDPTHKNLTPPRSPGANLALPTPPHSAGLPPTRVPSIWVETDGGKTTPINGLDRSHSLHIFSSLTGRTPKKARRSNLVMSLTGADRSQSTSPSPIEPRDGTNASGTDSEPGPSGSTGPASPISPVRDSPVSLPATSRTLGNFHFRGPSSSSSNASLGPGPGPGSVGVDTLSRPGSAGARLTTPSIVTEPIAEGPLGTPVRVTPRRSLVSRASSVILRRLSAATMGSVGKGKSSSPPSTQRRSRETARLSSVGSTSGSGCGALVEGEVMLIGSPYAEPFDDP